MTRVPLREIAPLLRLTVRNWHNDRAPRLGSALAYYMALSLAPAVIIILAVTGIAFGAKAARPPALANSGLDWIRRRQGDSEHDRRTTPVFDRRCGYLGGTSHVIFRS